MRAPSCASCCLASIDPNQDYQINSEDGSLSYTLSYRSADNNPLTYYFTSVFQRITPAGYVEEVPGPNYSFPEDFTDALANYAFSGIYRDRVKFVAIYGYYIPSGGELVLVSIQIFESSGVGMFRGYFSEV